MPRLKRLSPAARTTLGRLVPFAAVASAGALNVFLMRGEEMRRGIDVFPAVASRGSDAGKAFTERKAEAEGSDERISNSGDSGSEATTPPSAPPSLGKSKIAARLAVSETALSRVMNATPIMVLPPLILVRLQRTEWLRQRPRMVLPVNLGLILATSIFALPLALGVFPQRQAISAKKLEEEFWDKGGEGGMVEFNRGI